MKAPSTAEQRKLLHVLAYRLGMDDEEYRLLLARSYGVTSSTKLTRNEIQLLIQTLKAKAIEMGVWKERLYPRKKYDDLGSRGNLASPGQLRLIEILWNQVSWAENKPEALNRFLEKRWKCTLLELDRKQAAKVIYTLKIMLQQKEKKP